MKQATHNYFSVISLGSILALRLIGLFMILPVFAVYAVNLEASTPLLVGIAIGGYGLTQAFFQLPFGMLSDKFGRKPIIAIGLVLFGLGSIIAAMADSIHVVILGRLLQGTGAIGSTIIATVADVTTEEQRTKAMAIVGMMIGASFFMAMILGPVLHTFMDIPGLFWISSGMALLALVLLLITVPTPKDSVASPHVVAIPSLFKTLLKDKNLLRLDLGIFILHAILTATFVVTPMALGQVAGMPIEAQWQFYLPVLGAAFIVMLILLNMTDRKTVTGKYYPFAILLLVISQGLLAYQHHTVMNLAAGLFLFFTAFSFLEAYLPAMVTKYAPSDSRGSAMGIYSTSQFLGIFVGGMLGGLIYNQFHITGVFIFGAFLSGLWFIMTPRPQTSKPVGEFYGQRN